MRRLGEEFMDRDRKDGILSSIAEARDIATRLDERAAALPPWALSENGPMGADAAKYANALRLRKDREADVASIERRLSSGGPVWPTLTDPERKALSDWMGAIDTQAALLGKYYPTESQIDVMKIALLAVGFGSLFLPLLFTEAGPEERAPLRFPSSAAPARAPFALQPPPSPFGPARPALPLPPGVSRFAAVPGPPIRREFAPAYDFSRRGREYYSPPAPPAQPPGRRPLL
jgi:hypothetical protein